MNDNKDLQELLLRAEGKQEAVRPEELVPSLKFTRGAYEKAELIGPIIEGLTKRHLEWSAFLLAEKGDPDCIVRDVFIQRDQEIRYGNVMISGEAIVQASNEVQTLNKAQGNQRYIIGWIHGHGLAANRPSIPDRETFDKVLNSVSLNTERSIVTPLQLIETEVQRSIENNVLRYKGSALEDAVVTYEVREREVFRRLLGDKQATNGDLQKKSLELMSKVLGASTMKVYQPEIFGFAYFVIMNNKQETPYAAMNMILENIITRNKTTELFDDEDIEQVVVPNDIVVDERDIRAEIKDKIKLDFPKVVVSKIKKGKQVFGKNVTSTTTAPVETLMQDMLPKGSKPVPTTVQPSQLELHLDRPAMEAILQECAFYERHNQADVAAILDFMEALWMMQHNKVLATSIIQKYFRERFIAPHGFQDTFGFFPPETGADHGRD
ncbi:MAG: hypothetical protein Q7R96_04340 [Nanoarchaeota archaeon]|nr:hypothetical protein [Nanoarchaeota archaeon]